MAAGESLRLKGYQVTGTTRSPDKLSWIREKLGAAVLWTDDTFQTAFENQDLILFTAAPSTSSDYTSTYLENAERIVKAFKAHPELRQVIYTSSTSVYGEHAGESVTEETFPKPLNPQTEILLKTEQHLLSLPTTCIFRLGELIGPNRSLEGRLRRMQGAPLPGTGQSITNFSPLSDVVRAIHFAIDHSLVGLYNLCSPLHVSRRELYELIAAAKKLPPIIWDPHLSALHGGNKRVVSQKIIDQGFRFNGEPWEGILDETPLSLRS